MKETLVDSLVQLLTPKRRIDIIRDVLEAKANKKPYVIAFCGVNGVGKSTNLAKICFWLVENKCSVLIAACDTFRYAALPLLSTRKDYKFKLMINSWHKKTKQPIKESCFHMFLLLIAILHRDLRNDFFFLNQFTFSNI